jgi:hypothetical protein
VHPVHCVFPKGKRLRKSAACARKTIDTMIGAGHVIEVGIGFAPLGYVPLDNGVQ